MFSIMRKSFDMSGDRGATFFSQSPKSDAGSPRERKSAASRRSVWRWAPGGAGLVPHRRIAGAGGKRHQADVIAGTSIGAVIGGCYAAGKLDQIEVFARSLTKRRVFAMMDLSFSGMSLINGDRLKSALEKELNGIQIETLSTPFAAVATEVGTGHEVWLQQGPIALRSARPMRFPAFSSRCASETAICLTARWSIRSR